MGLKVNFVAKNAGGVRLAPWPGRSAVWLACVVRDDEVESSNLSAPTINLTTPYNIVSGWAILSKAEPEGKNLVDRAKAFNILPL